MMAYSTSRNLWFYYNLYPASQIWYFELLEVNYQILFSKKIYICPLN